MTVSHIGAYQRWVGNLGGPDGTCAKQITCDCQKIPISTERKFPSNRQKLALHSTSQVYLLRGFTRSRLEM